MKRQTFWIEVTRAQFLKLPMSIRRKELRGHADKFVTLEVVAAKLDASEKRNAQWQKKWELSCETLGNSLEREQQLSQQLECVLRREARAEGSSCVTKSKEAYRRASKGRRAMLRAWFQRVLSGEDGNA